MYFQVSCFTSILYHCILFYNRYGCKCMYKWKKTWIKEGMEESRNEGTKELRQMNRWINKRTNEWMLVSILEVRKWWYGFFPFKALKKLPVPFPAHGMKVISYSKLGSVAQGCKGSIPPVHIIQKCFLCKLLLSCVKLLFVTS